MKRLIHSILCALLALCLLSGSCALAGSSVGSTASSLSPATVRPLVQLSKSVTFFTGDTYGTGTVVVVPAGGVYILLSDNFYTPSDGLAYYGVYYNNTRYNVLRSDVYSDLMTDAEIQSWMESNVWNASSYTTLKKSMNLNGNVSVYGLQLALKQLGYYNGAPDGDYGDLTAAAVKSFQKANGLTADGSAGVLTQPVIYAKVGGSSSSSSSSSSTSTSTDGTITVTASSVNLRKSYSKSSTLLTVVPKGTSLAYSDSQVSGGVTWYQVTYNSRTGWVMGTYVSVGSSSSSSSTSSASTTLGTLKTTSSVNLRKSATTSSARLAVVPKSVNLSYTNTATKSGVTWYYVTYQSISGWLMGTYVSATSSSSSSSSSSSTAAAIGQVQITMGGTRVRKTANGSKTGTVLSKGTVVDLIATPTSAGGYTWYNIRTASGLVGFVRGDCATLVSSGGGTSSVSGSLVKLPAATSLFTTQAKSSTGVTVSAGTVLMLASGETYTLSGVEYCTVYYNNTEYNCVFSEISSGILSTANTASYVAGLYNTSLPYSLKTSLGLRGDVYVYALQTGLKTLGYYTGELDGTLGTGTVAAIRNFQSANNLTADGACGSKTWSAFTAKLGGSGSGSGSGSSVVVADFGTVNKVVKASWDYGDNGASLFPKNSYATVMDIATGKVFNIYRWSGGNHADCVPVSTSDTKIMCEIVGFTYNSSAPTAAQLAKIKADGDSSTVTYTWPDFKNAFGGATNIGSAWDRRACLLNVDGTVYCVSIYGFPHGFNGTDSFSKAKFPNGTLFYVQNNYYGMMCVHFVGSKTHSSTNIDSQHQANIDKAYEYAKKLWPTLCK